MPADGTPALLFLDTQTGVTRIARWPQQTLHSWDFLGPWSPAGLLLARRRGNTHVEALFEVFDCTGCCTASVTVIGRDGAAWGFDVGVWAPRGRARLLLIGRDCSWLWDLAAGSLQHMWTDSFQGRTYAPSCGGVSVGRLAWCPVADNLTPMSQLVSSTEGAIWCGQLGAAVMLQDLHGHGLLLFSLCSGQPRRSRQVALGSQ